MTQRMYYDDSYHTDFKARILDRRPLEIGVGLVLDQTCFYPSSGGQPFDTGWLNGVPVVDVFEDGAEIVHVVERDVPGEVVNGRIDWARRFDHMQQHTGQHLLSEAFQRLFGAVTQSFHLGKTSCTIDLAQGALRPKEIARAEHLANEIVLENRPISARFYDQGELADIPLRKLPTKAEDIRIVAIQDFDYSPCGGTHCCATGQVGPIKVRKWERRGQKTRVEFLCGWRALNDYSWKHEAITALANAFSVKDTDVVETVTRLTEEAKESQKELQSLRGRLLDYEAEALVARAPSFGDVAIVTSIFEDRGQEQVRHLALRIAGAGRRIAILGIGGAKARLILARSAKAPGNMNLLLREICQTFGGGGGGQPHLAQGGGLDTARLEEALNFASTRIRATIQENRLGGSKE